MSQRIDTRVAQRCAWVQIRRTDRVITQFYSEILAPSGLNATQFALLATLAEIAPTTIHRFAEIMDMERTTLIRNLEVLNRQHLVQSQTGEDRRSRPVHLTAEGFEALQNAWPVWQEACTRVERILGQDHFDNLLMDLTAIRVAIR